jgi:hypothetical protein
MGRSLSEAANYVLQQLESFGINIPGGSRIEDMYKAVCNKNGSSRGFIPENDPDFDVAKEALRDFTQLEFYFDSAKALACKNEHKSKLKQVVSGTTLPEDSGANTSARNAQAELFVFAVCENAGLAPDFQEPDVTCSLNRRTFGIAVKRIKNLTQFEKRVNEGANQIQKAGFPGIVSIEISMAANPDNKSIFTNENESQVKKWWEKQMRKITDKYHGKLFKRVYGKNVLGIFTHEHYPVRFGKHYNLRSMHYGISTVENETGEADWEEFKNAFLSGLPNLIK